jgi:hypothetical protein
MKILTKIQIVFTVLTVVAVVGQVLITRWILSMIWSNPTREFWQPICVHLHIDDWFLILFPWFLFTISHLIIVISRVFSNRSNV